MKTTPHLPYPMPYKIGALLTYRTTISAQDHGKRLRLLYYLPVPSLIRCSLWTGAEVTVHLDHVEPHRDAAEDQQRRAMQSRESEAPRASEEIPTPALSFDTTPVALPDYVPTPDYGSSSADSTPSYSDSSSSSPDYGSTPDYSGGGGDFGGSGSSGEW